MAQAFRGIDARVTGECWCGCGASTRSFFVKNHNIRERTKVLKGICGEEGGYATARLMLIQGLGPPEQQLDTSTRVSLLLAWAQEIEEASRGA